MEQRCGRAYVEVLGRSTHVRKAEVRPSRPLGITEPRGEGSVPGGEEPAMSADRLRDAHYQPPPPPPPPPPPEYPPPPEPPLLEGGVLEDRKLFEREVFMCCENTP